MRTVRRVLVVSCQLMLRTVCHALMFFCQTSVKECRVDFFFSEYIL